MDASTQSPTGEPESEPCTVCGSECVNTSTNSKHCGECYKACGFGDVCTNGGCTASNPPLRRIYTVPATVGTSVNIAYAAAGALYFTVPHARLWFCRVDDCAGTAAMVGDIEGPVHTTTRGHVSYGHLFVDGETQPREALGLAVGDEGTYTLANGPEKAPVLGQPAGQRQYCILGKCDLAGGCSPIVDRAETNLEGHCHSGQLIWMPGGATWGPWVYYGRQGACFVEGWTSRTYFSGPPCVEGTGRELMHLRPAGTKLYGISYKKDHVVAFPAGPNGPIVDAGLPVEGYTIESFTSSGDRAFIGTTTSDNWHKRGYLVSATESAITFTQVYSWGKTPFEAEEDGSVAGTGLVFTDDKYFYVSYNLYNQFGDKVAAIYQGDLPAVP